MNLKKRAVTIYSPMEPGNNPINLSHENAVRLVKAKSVSAAPVRRISISIVGDQLQFLRHDSRGRWVKTLVALRDITSFGVRHKAINTKQGTFSRWQPVGFLAAKETEYVLPKSQVSDLRDLLRHYEVKIIVNRTEVVDFRSPNNVAVRKVNFTYTYA